MAEISDFSERLKKRAKEKNYTQERIASALHCSLPAVKKWYSGANYPEIETMITLASKDFLDCDLDYLIGRIDQKNHDNKFICEETGLSESSLEYIQELPEPEKEILNELLSSKSGLSSILRNIAIARYNSCSVSDLNGEQTGQTNPLLINAVRETLENSQYDLASLAIGINRTDVFGSIHANSHNVIRGAELEQLECKDAIRNTVSDMITKMIPPAYPDEFIGKGDYVPGFSHYAASKGLTYPPEYPNNSSDIELKNESVVWEV